MNYHFKNEDGIIYTDIKEQTNSRYDTIRYDTLNVVLFFFYNLKKIQYIEIIILTRKVKTIIYIRAKNAEKKNKMLTNFKENYEFY